MRPRMWLAQGRLPFYHFRESMIPAQGLPDGKTPVKIFIVRFGPRIRDRAWGLGLTRLGGLGIHTYSEV